MKALNTVKITFPSRSVNEGFARSALSAFAAQADPTLDELADVKTAVSEAVTNCIVHAYANTIGPITLTAALYEDGTLRVAVADKGCGIPGGGTGAFRQVSGGCRARGSQRKERRDGKQRRSQPLQMGQSEKPGRIWRGPDGLYR